MPMTEQVQLVFGGGVNAAGPQHAIGDDQVQSATNVDFSLERGAASCRRGSTRLHTVTSSAVQQIARNYNSTTVLSASPYYINSSNNIYRGVSGVFSAIQTGGAGSISAFSAYRQHALIALTAGTNCIKDDGTNATDWVKQSPASAPTVTVSTLGGVSVVATSGYSVVEGTLVGTDVLTPTITLDATTFRGEIRGTLATTNLNTNGSLLINDYGVDSISIKFTRPDLITKVSRDYSIADTSFTNYYHTEMDLTLGESEDALPDAEVLIDSLLAVGTGTGTHVDAETRAFMISEVRQLLRAPRTMVSAAKNVFNIWTVPRTKFELVSKAPTAGGWDNIQAIRVVIEGVSAISEVQVGAWEIRGAETYPLNDLDVGYSYWETWATVESGNVTSESAPSPPSTRTKMQQSQAIIASASGTATGGTSGLTHRIFYRQGGYLNDAYAVSTVAFATATITDTVTDMAALSLRNRMLRNILPRSEFYSNIVAVSEPFYERAFVGYLNKIAWSLPGRPDTFPRTSNATVAAAGDEVQALVSWAPTLVIINRDSVWELQGSEFEGSAQNWTLSKTGSRHGSKAPRTIIKTPFGIPLLDYDGISMYQPGQGIDLPIDWAMERLADVFRGNATSDPAALKGSRIPAVNNGVLNQAAAAWADGKLYLALACGVSQTTNNYVFVLDFRAQQVWVYNYPFDISSLFWDFEVNRLMAGTTDGKLMQLETGTQDQTSAGTPTAVTYRIKTRAWTAPADAVLENLSVEYKGGTASLNAIYDGTSTTSIAVFTNATKDWLIPPLRGTIANNVVFQLDGTQGSGQQAALYGIAFEALVEPKRVEFFKTEYITPNATGESLWDVHYAGLDIPGTSTVTGSHFVDGSAVSSNTYVGPSSGLRRYANSYPGGIYGRVGHTVYSGGAGHVFKHWDTRVDARAEPPRVNSWRTDVVSLEENRCEALDFDVNPNGTITGITYVDNTAVHTFTRVGTNQQSYTEAYPTQNLYGRTLFTTFTGSGFKVYKEWHHLIKEPDRLAMVQTEEFTYPADQTIKTWVADINPLGTTTAFLYSDDAAIGSATFTGNTRAVFLTGVDLSAGNALQSARKLKVNYFAVGTNAVLKHYNTKFETETEPFAKRNWAVSYEKLGGASQLDQARFWSYDIEVPAGGTATITSIWDIDGSAFSTNTHTVVARDWEDRIPFPAGGRGYLFQQRIISAVPIQVWRTNLDAMRVGIKGLTRVTLPGSPR